jgi:hypothetical protein
VVFEHAIENILVEELILMQRLLLEDEDYVSFVETVKVQALLAFRRICSK